MHAFCFSILCSLTFLTASSSAATLSNFEPGIHLSGDARIVADHVTLASSAVLRRSRPLAFSSPATSLSTHFSFSLSPAAGHGFLLILSPPSNSSRFVAVHFHANRVAIDAGSRVAGNANLALNSGEKLNAWVDYEGSSKTLEVRLSKLGKKKPWNPVVSHWVDLFKMWGGDPVFAGLSCSNGAHSAQVVSIYSWRVSTREGSSEEEHSNFCPLTVLAGVIFGTGCVALLAFVLLFTWVIFFPAKPDHSLVNIPHDVAYQKIDVAVYKNSQDHDQS
ncbi:hypothetical protein Fmac_014534 [Flemingia macrophylla]|uniref:Legume lectin domain-containing protein n=1 Tax=Flemingia macrophylla TaxID=520843 RepID=A0ABD1MC04_9FABA